MPAHKQAFAGSLLHSPAAWIEEGRVLTAWIAEFESSQFNLSKSIFLIECNKI